MKKLLSLFICLLIICSSIPVFAEVTIELNPLKYDEYMYGETIFVSGTSNDYVYLSLHYPENFGGNSKWSIILSNEELKNGYEIKISDEHTRDWPEGEWTIRVNHGEVANAVTFTLSETVDRTEEPSTKPSTGNNTSVGTIVPEKRELTLTAGDTEKINISTSASRISVEVEDEKVVAASISGKTLTVTALSRGKSAIWLKISNNYANVNVTVEAKPYVEEPVEKPTEEETTELPTEEVTEESTEAPAENENPFTDLPDNHWAKDSIIKLYKKGIISGMTKTTFEPDRNVTRAQFVAMLVRALGFKATTKVSPFNDVEETHWALESILAAYDNDITKGDNMGGFNPNLAVNREDMATLAFRAGTKVGIPFVMTTPYMFDDHDMISDYAVEAVYAMKSLGIINGMTEKTFEPRGFATRAQAAHIIAKLMDNM